MTWYKKISKHPEVEFKSKDIIIAKISRITENLQRKKTQEVQQDVQMNSYLPSKKPTLWNIISELTYDLDGIQEKMTDSSKTKQSKKPTKTAAGASAITTESSF